MSYASEFEEEVASGASSPEVEQRAALLRVMLGEIDAKTRTLVKQRPLLALGITLALGYVLGRALARK